VPVFSEPTGRYRLEDLRREVRKRLVPAYQTTHARRYVKKRILDAATFDQLLDVVMHPLEGIEEPGSESYPDV